MSETGSRNQDAYEALKQDIARFHFKPGERLREEALSARYAVSRTPIRRPRARTTARRRRA